MSKKSTKIIAAAGVVAGLGVAALPAMTFAAETIKAGVNVKAIVNEAIAMTITGNDDTTWQTAAETPVSVTGDSIFAPTDAKMINSYNTSNGEAYVDGTTDIRYASGSKAELLPNAKIDGDGTNGFKSLITVYTNSANGYTITVQDEDASTDLVLGNNVDTIPAGTTIAAGTSAWGYTLTSGSSYAAVPASTGTAASIKSDGSAFADGEQTTVYYGVSTKAAQKSGIYTDKIVYTAATKNGA